LSSSCIKLHLVSLQILSRKTLSCSVKFLILAFIFFPLMAGTSSSSSLSVLVCGIGSVVWWNPFRNSTESFPSFDGRGKALIKISSFTNEYYGTHL
jgi:hypothetical protein